VATKKDTQCYDPKAVLRTIKTRIKNLGLFLLFKKKNKVWQVQSSLDSKYIIISRAATIEYAGNTVAADAPRICVEKI
jgi:hypothetical protein